MKPFPVHRFSDHGLRSYVATCQRHHIERLLRSLLLTVGAILLSTALPPLVNSPISVTVLAQPEATLYFSPPTLNLDSSSPSGTVDLRIRNSQDLVGYDFDLSFDPRQVIIDRVEQTIGSDDATWVAVPQTADRSVSFVRTNETTITFGGYRLTPGKRLAGVNGDHVLARLHLRAVPGGTAPPGTSALRLIRIALSDSAVRIGTARASEVAIRVRSFPPPLPTAVEPTIPPQ